MDRSVLMAIVIGLMFVFLSLLVVGWYARRRRQTGVTAPRATPADPGRLVGVFTGKYVATTVAGDPFDRIAVHGLAFRGATTVTVTENGLAVQIVGADEIWIPQHEVVDVSRATWTIDRAVEKDGMHLIRWTLGDRQVDSYFRMDAPGPFTTAVQPFTQKQAA